MAQRYDVIVIGAGLGGLTAAALLARAGRKTLVIERNASVGGAASTYKVGDLTVEASLHETTDPSDPGDPKHSILARIGVLALRRRRTHVANHEGLGNALCRSPATKNTDAQASRRRLHGRCR